MQTSAAKDAGRRQVGRLSLSTIPDGVIGAYFALFALAVVAFLSTQALRARAVERAHPAASHAVGFTTR